MRGGLAEPSKTLESLTRAVCPTRWLDDVVVTDTVAEIEKSIDSFGTANRKLIRTAIRLLELSTVRRAYGWRPFSVLDRGEAVRALESLAAAPPPFGQVVRLLRDIVVLCHYEHPILREAVGYDPDPWIAERSTVRERTWAGEIEAHRRLLVSPDPLLVLGGPARRRADHVGGIFPGSDLPVGGLVCDVVVVGSGAGGAVVAAELAEAGLDVVVLEEGGHHPTESFGTSTTETLRELYRDGGASTTLGRVPVQFSEGRCVGGSTVVNGAMAFRASERILEHWAATSGLRGLSMSEMDDEYRRVERFVSAKTQDPGSEGRDQVLLRAGAERLGWKVIDNTRAQVHCAGCNVCTWGCPTGAKQSALVSYIPRATAFGARVFSGCRVERVNMHGKRAIGVQGHLAQSAHTPPRSFSVSARKVVVSCGAIQTPALLQRSGVRPHSGTLGRNLAVHPGAAVVAVFDEQIDAWKGAHQTVQVRQFEDEGIIMAAVNLPPSLVAMSLPSNGDELGEAMLSYNRMVTAGVLVEDHGRGRVRALGTTDTAVATYQLDERDESTVRRAVSLLSEALFAAGARSVHLPLEDHPALEGPDDLRRFSALTFASRALRLTTVHVMGTAAIGSDPARAVCDRRGAVYDTADLYVADASLFPGPVGVNPMLTIMALATKVASGLIEELA